MVTLSRARPAPPAPPATDSDGGFTARPHSRAAARLPTLLLYAALVLLMVIGALDIAGKFTHHTTPPPVQAPVLDAAAASAAAARYAADYLGYDSATPTQRAAALGADADTAPDTLTGFTGVGQLHPTVVLPGTVTPAGLDTAVVAVTVAVTPAFLPPGALLPTTQAAPTVPGLAGTPGPIGAPWQADTTRWLTLHVAVHRVNGVLRGTAAALAGADRPTPLPVPAAAAVDSALTTATAGLPGDVFTAYAAGRMTYLTVPGATLTGLGQAATVDHVTDWTVYTATDPAGARTATATVTWALPDGLTIAQRYVLHLQARDGRWLVDGIDVRLED